MDAEPASPPTSMVAGPSSLWRLAEQRSRKAGSGNIFGGVNLWQLQRLFKAAGDQDAEQRAQLVWGHGDEAELAQALIGLRARTRRRGLKTEGALGSRWLRAFNHLRIGESQDKDPGEESKAEGARSSSEPRRHALIGATGGVRGPPVSLPESQGPAGTSDKPPRGGPGLRRAENNPERYLHRILH